MPVSAWWRGSHASSRGGRRSGKWQRVPPDADGLVVLCAANNYDGVKVADHHLAERLARLAPVLYVDPPLSRLTPRNDPRLAPSLTGPRLRRGGGGVLALPPPGAPLPPRPGMRAAAPRPGARAM